MTRWSRGILGLLALLLIMMLCPAMAQEAAPTLEDMLYDGDTAGIWALVTPKYGVEYVQRGYAKLVVTPSETPVFASVPSKEYAAQNRYTLNIQEVNGTGFSIETIDIYVYSPSSDCFMAAGSLNVAKNTRVEPYGCFKTGIGGPRDNPRYELYEVIGTDDNGHELRFYGVVDRSCVIPSSEGIIDDSYDIGNLRLNASYEESVSDGIWWVPVSSLGTTRYTNSDIAARLDDKPEAKQAAYSTLYEALQLFELSNFYSSDDNQRISENGINWEHHKPGYDAVRTNNGCCASDSNWLNYILKDDYEEVGFLAFSQTDGSGHILNYIKQDGYYYFIDLTHYRTDFLDSGAVESGSMSDYNNSDRIAGNLHKATSPEAYVEYYLRFSNEQPGLFFLYQHEDCLPLTGSRDNSFVVMLYPNDVEITLVYDDPRDQLRYEQVTPPSKKFAWDKERDASFVADDKYVNAQVASEAFGLDVQIGDTLDFPQAGMRAPKTIEVGGNEYGLLQHDDRTVFVSFREALHMTGGHDQAYFDYGFVPTWHDEGIRDFDSVWVGDYMIDVAGVCDRVQRVRCVEEGDKLVVQNVQHQVFNTTERIFLDRTPNGRWADIKPIWDLICYEKNGKLYYRYIRFGIAVQLWG